MTEITIEGDIKLEVMSTYVEGKQKSKRHNEQLTWEWKKNLKKKIQITDWKTIYMPNQWLVRHVYCWENVKKKEKKEAENVVEKRKKKEKLKDKTTLLF